jgi:CubicO group peptidase (beta-lactamase class C family)
MFSTSYGQQNIRKSKKVKSLEKSIEQVMERSDCMGMAVAVVSKNEIIYAKGFGYRDYENKLEADASTLFAIGSCTKAFTGSLIGQLHDKKQLDIDKPVRDYLPSLRFFNDNMNSMINLRDMLCHRTGLPRHDLSWYMFPSNSRDSLIARIKYHEPSLEVRESYQYNNFMYMAAGAVTEEITNKSWEENIREELFKPLGMTSSNLHIDELKSSENKAYGYFKNKADVFERDDYYKIRGMAPAGSINSNALDMGNWLICWINDGEFKNKQIIPSTYIAEASSSQIAASSGSPSSKRPGLHFSNYGFGWSTSSYNGHYRVEHGGNIDGFTASTCFFPTDSIGIVVLVNQNYSRVPSIVRNMIADKLLKLKSGKWDESLRKKEKASKKEESEDEEEASWVSNRVKGTSPSHDLDAYTGKFYHPGYGTIIIENQNDSLIGILPERKWWLRHNHYDVFEPFEMEESGIDTSSSGYFVFNFRTNMNGDIEGIAVNAEGSLDPLLFEKQIEEVEVEASDLEKFVGEYDLGGAMAKVYIKNKNTLMLFVPGQPEYTLMAIDDHKFNVKDLDGFSIDFEIKEAAVEAMILIQPNGTFRVPKKD